MKVLIVPEDFSKDQFILKPVFSRLLASIGKPRAKVRVCRDPLLGGIDEALKKERIAEIIDRYGDEVRIIILCVDRDGKPGRRLRLDNIEREMERRIETTFGDGLDFLAADAWEELEAWVLAGLELPGDWRWTVVRAEVQVKERYFDRLANSLGLAEDHGGGRERLGNVAARRVNVIRQKCPEDFDYLAQRLEAIVQRN